MSNSLEGRRLHGDEEILQTTEEMPRSPRVISNIVEIVEPLPEIPDNVELGRD